MLDDALKVWLLEVNASPSMGLETALDRNIKPKMVADTIALVDPVPFDRKVLARMAKQRLEHGFYGARPPQSKEEQRAAVQAITQKLLQGREPRLYGQQPKAMGLYERVAPSAVHDTVSRLKRAAFKTPTNHRESLPLLV